MTTATILLSLFALVLGVLAGVAIGRITDRPREPQTDEEHAQLVELKAHELNIAMHNARMSGLNPAIQISPLDPDLSPSSRPLRVTVQRLIGQDVPTERVEDLQPLRVGEHVYSRFFDDSYLEVVRYVDDNNWWFKIIGQEEKGIAKAKTPFSQMPRTREEAYRNNVR